MNIGYSKSKTDLSQAESGQFLNDLIYGSSKNVNFKSNPANIFIPLLLFGLAYIIFRRQ